MGGQEGADFEISMILPLQNCSPHGTRIAGTRHNPATLNKFGGHFPRDDHVKENGALGAQHLIGRATPCAPSRKENVTDRTHPVVHTIKSAAAKFTTAKFTTVGSSTMRSITLRFLKCHVPSTAQKAAQPPPKPIMLKTSGAPHNPDAVIRSDV